MDEERIMSLAQTLRQWLWHWQARWYYLRGNTYRHFGNLYGDQQQYEAAVDDYTRALSLDPRLARAYLDRGILYWRELDHPRRAIQDLTTAEELDPTLTEARFNRGVAYQQLREYDRAVADFQAYLAVGTHPHWREYAQRMIEELSEWVVQPG